MERLYKEFGDKILFIGISRDTRKEIDNFMRENVLTFPVAHDEANLASQVFHERVPTHVLISTSGIVKYSEPEAPADIRRFLMDDIR